MVPGRPTFRAALLMHFRTWGDAPEPLVQSYLCTKNRKAIRIKAHSKVVLEPYCPPVFSPSRRLLVNPGLCYPPYAGALVLAYAGYAGPALSWQCYAGLNTSILRSSGQHTC